MKGKYLVGIIAVIVAAAAAFAFIGLNGPTQSTPPERLVIATTTSTVDTGLLDYLKPSFDNKFHANMTWLYLGTGQALAVASRGDADILLVHDRVREDAFVKAGNGTHRVTVMYNDFVLIGPQDDPAGVKGMSNVTEAFKLIAAKGEAGKATFVSRGDKSGTNALELRIWSSAKINTKGKPWYVEAGQGMGPTIKISNEKQAYTVSDRGTWIKLKAEMGDNLKMQILVEGDKSLLNPYGIILLNAEKYPNINSKLAEKFFLFMISDEGQGLIANYKVGGNQLFFPIFGKPEQIGLPSEKSEVQYWAQQLTSNQMKPPNWVQQIMAVAIPSLFTGDKN
ncbi:MAG: substrate-binding domain-containing protein [Thaumarchaeota archaeon]|nr:substrate-binding domain-containing protein [Nitrososphaerota archaeon]MCL5317796.1 substrate-binding domain-containing protein [Nitrososphaerota archaeon]